MQKQVEVKQDDKKQDPKVSNLEYGLTKEQIDTLSDQLKESVNYNSDFIDAIVRALKYGTFLKRVNSGGNTSKVKLKLSDDDFNIQVGTKKIPVTELQEVREGKNSDLQTFRLLAKNEKLRQYSSVSFTLVFKRASDNQSFITASEFSYLLWSKGFKKWTEVERDPEAFFIEKSWVELFGSKESLITLKDVLTILNRLNFSANSNLIKDKLKEITSDDKVKFDFQDFILLIRKLRIKYEFENVFKKYSSDKLVLTPAELLEFLKTEQGEYAELISVDDCKNIISKFRKKNAETEKKEQKRKATNKAEREEAAMIKAAREKAEQDLKKKRN